MNSYWVTAFSQAGTPSVTSTYTKGWMVTPRGYRTKYDLGAE